MTCVLLINFILKSRLIWKMLSINFYVVSGIAGEFCSAIISDYPMKKFNDVMRHNFLRSCFKIIQTASREHSVNIS